MCGTIGTGLHGRPAMGGEWGTGRMGSWSAGMLCVLLALGGFPGNGQAANLETAQPAARDDAAPDEAATPDTESEDTAGDALLGSWLTQSASAIVDVNPCEDNPDRYCGRVVWTWNKPDFIGSLILSDFEWTGEEWEGRILDPESGDDYRSSLSLTDDEHLAVKGCKLVFCRTQNWMRPDVMMRALTDNNGNGSDRNDPPKDGTGDEKEGG